MKFIMENWRKLINEILTIKKSPIHGTGIFATVAIPAHTSLGVAQSKDPSSQWQATKLGKLHNHSSQATCYNKMASGTRELFPHKDLKPGEEITIDYDEAPLEVAFNNAYLLDLLNAIPEEKVKMVFVDDDRRACVLVSPVDKKLERQYVVMAMIL